MDEGDGDFNDDYDGFIPEKEVVVDQVVDNGEEIEVVQIEGKQLMSYQEEAEFHYNKVNELNGIF